MSIKLTYLLKHFWNKESLLSKNQLKIFVFQSQYNTHSNIINYSNKNVHYELYTNDMK